MYSNIIKYIYNLKIYKDIIIFYKIIYKKNNKSLNKLNKMVNFKNNKLILL